MHTEPLLPHFLFLYVGLFTVTNPLPQDLKLHLSITSRKLHVFSHESAPPDSDRAARSIQVSTHHHHRCSCNLADWLCPPPPLPLTSSGRLVHPRIIERPLRSLSPTVCFHLCKQAACPSPRPELMNFWELHQERPRRLQSPSCCLGIRLGFPLLLFSL